MTGLNVDFLPRSTLEGLGFRALGNDVLVHGTAVLVGCDAIALGSRVRIDPYVVISVSGGLAIGNNVHIAAHCSLSGRAAISFADFCGLSQGVRVFSSTDDYGGASLTNSTVPEMFKAVRSASVRMGRHVIVGAGSVILPGAELSDGAAIGALSMVSGTLDPWSIYAGVPLRRLGDRRRDLASIEAAYAATLSAG